MGCASCIVHTVESWDGDGGWVMGERRHYQPGIKAFSGDSACEFAGMDGGVNEFGGARGLKRHGQLLSAAGDESQALEEVRGCWTSDAHHLQRQAEIPDICWGWNYFCSRSRMEPMSGWATQGGTKR